MAHVLFRSLMASGSNSETNRSGMRANHSTFSNFALPVMYWSCDDFSAADWRQAIMGHWFRDGWPGQPSVLLVVVDWHVVLASRY